MYFSNETTDAMPHNCNKLGQIMRKSVNKGACYVDHKHLS